MASETIRIPRALLTLGEVAALFECSVCTVTRWADVEQLERVSSSWLKEARFDRHDVERLLRARLTDADQLAARRRLVRLVCGELGLKHGRLVETGLTGGLDVGFCDEELIETVTKAVTDLVPEVCSRAAFDAWASAQSCPSSETVMRRLCIFTWPRVIARALARIVHETAAAPLVGAA